MSSLRLFAVSLLVPCLLSGCNSATDSAADPSGSAGGIAVAVQLNWHAESEHGGVYQALSDGTYDKANLAVDVRPGGSGTPVGPELELGRVQFGFANADDVVLFRREGMDIVAVLAAMQNSPRCILVREDSGARSFDELAGMTLQRNPGRSFVQFMRMKGILEGVTEVPYHGSVASLIADPKIAIQAYSFSEPLLAEQQGVKVRPLMVSDLGWNPYSSVLITTGKLIREEPEMVRQFVQATQRGWKNYLQDATKGNAAILLANKHGMTAEALEYGCNGLRSLAIPEGASMDNVGMMSDERWAQLVMQMDSLQPDEAGKVKAEECFTSQFLQ